MSEPAVLHQHVLGHLYTSMLVWTRAEAGRGAVSLPLDVRLDDANVLAPDILW